MYVCIDVPVYLHIFYVNDYELLLYDSAVQTHLNYIEVIHQIFLQDMTFLCQIATLFVHGDN